MPNLGGGGDYQLSLTDFYDSFNLLKKKGDRDDRDYKKKKAG